MTERDNKALMKRKVFTMPLEDAVNYPLLLAVSVSLGNVHKIEFDEDKSVYMISEDQYNSLCKKHLEE